MKTMGVCLLVIAGLIIMGLFSYWHFESWQVLDWVIVIFNISAGIYLILKEKNGK